MTEGDATITDNTTSITDSVLQGGNATTSAAGAGGNQSDLRLHLEEARTALHNNDTQAALLHLDLILNTLGSPGDTQGNMTSNNTIAGSGTTNTESENTIPPVGGISGADEDNEISDIDAAGGNDDDSNSNMDANRRETYTEEEDSERGGVTVGGTSAADDYGCPPDPDG